MGIEGILGFVVWLVVLCIIFGLVRFIVSKLELEQPIGKWVDIILVVAFALILIGLLLNFMGMAPAFNLHR